MDHIKQPCNLHLRQEWGFPENHTEHMRTLFEHNANISVLEQAVHIL
jgi:hypothetical protein